VFSVWHFPLPHGRGSLSQLFNRQVRCEDKGTSTYAKLPVLLTSADVSMSRFCTLLAVLIVLLSLVPLTEAANAKRPNILFIIADDQSPFDLKMYNPRSVLDTSTLDRLAAEGMVFDGAYHMGSWSGAVCTPSRHMVMSGRTVWHLPNRTNRKRNPNDDHTGLVPPDLADFTLPAVFNRAGYDTMRTCKRGNSYEAASKLFTVRRDESLDRCQLVACRRSPTDTDEQQVGILQCLYQARKSIGVVFASMHKRRHDTQRLQMRPMKDWQRGLGVVLFLTDQIHNARHRRGPARALIITRHSQTTRCRQSHAHGQDHDQPPVDPLLHTSLPITWRRSQALRYPSVQRTDA